MLGFPDHECSPARWPRRRVGPVLAERGMVAAAHPLTVAAGLEILRQGGNAVDAAVGAGLAAAVVMPEMCGLGGDLFAVVHAPASADGRTKAQTVSVQGSGMAPRSATIDQMRKAGNGVSMPPFGPLSVAVPGMVDGYFALLDRFGTRSFGDVAEPAIGYAEGFPIYPLGAACIAKKAEILKRDPAAAAIFLPGGEVPEPGAILRQTDLARTLRQLADGGRDVFYRGDIARRIGEYLSAAGGALTAEDMADHETAITPPISTTYRGYTVSQTTLPSQGLIHLAALNIAEQADLRAIGVDSAEGIHLLVESLKLAFADRVGYCGDPTFCDVPLERLLSKKWAKFRHGQIDPERAAEEVLRGEMRDGDTTYLCVIDGEGMMVSLIQSVADNFGSGLVAGDTGVVLNNRAAAFSLTEGHPNVFAPGKKPIHTLNCFLIADQQGRPVLVGGTPGGSNQPQWNLQTIVGLIDAGWDVQQTVEQPRWSTMPATAPVTPDRPHVVQIERRVGQPVLDALAQRGHRLEVWDDWGAGGAAQVIVRDPETGVLAAGSDPRVEGLALGY